MILLKFSNADIAFSQLRLVAESKVVEHRLQHKLALKQIVDDSIPVWLYEPSAQTVNPAMWLGAQVCSRVAVRNGVG